MLKRCLRFIVPLSLALTIVLASFDNKATGSVQTPQIAGEDYSDQPAEAEQYYQLRRAPVGGTAIPAERYVSAMNHVKRMPVYATALASRLPVNHGYSIEAELSEWVQLGPGNIGGRTRSILVDPTTPSVMYAAGVAGGVWKSIDEGNSWQPLDDLLPNLAVSSMAMDPTDSKVIYAGTGEGFSNGDAVRGAGMLKTTDAGASWTYLVSTSNSNFFLINDLVISGNNHLRVYAATSTGVWVSNDGGTTWTLSFSNPAPSASCLDLALRTDKPTDYLFASFGNSAQATVFRNLDVAGNGTWSSVLSESNMGRTTLAIASSNQDVIYALAANLAFGDYRLGLLGVFRSSDGGATWTARVRNTDSTKLNTLLLSSLGSACGGTSNNQGWYDNVIAVDPLDENRVWAGGVAIFRSDDAGANWGLATGLHSDEHTIVFHPRYNGRQNATMYVGNDGGIYRTDNARAAVGNLPCSGGGGSVAWTSLNHSYGVTQFYNGTPYPDGKSYFGGTQDNGTLRGSDSAGPNSWSSMMGGDGGYVAIDPNDTNIIFAEFQNLAIRKSTDGGSTFRDAVTGITNSNFLFIVPFAMDPSNARRLWTGSNVVWRTTTGASQWTQASAPLFGTTSALAIFPGDGNRVIVGTNIGALHHSVSALSADSGTVWDEALPRFGFVSWVAYDPVDPNIIYATYSSFNQTGVSTDRHIYKTTDSGMTWAPIDGEGATGIPDIPVHCIVIDPTNRSRLYVGTDLGVFVSTNGGANWARENTGFANTPTESLSLTNAEGIVRLFAFTHGRGAYRVRLAAFTSRITGATANGKKLTVTGENFDTGAVILVNGQEVGTRNDDSNPKATLIAKKGAKKLGPGDTVTLRVRNGDGSLTPNFGFTLP